MSEINNYLDALVRELIVLLNEEKKLQVVDQDNNQAKDLGFAHCIHVQESESKKEYSLLVCDKSNHNDLHCAKIKCKYLKTLQHPNLIEYIDDFIIGQYHVIQIERIQTSLLNWIRDRNDRNIISELTIVEIAIQMLDVTYYLNKNKYSIDLDSTLSSFVINQGQRIKLIHFIRPQAVNIAKVKSVFNQCIEKKELFYYSIDILKKPIKTKIWQVYDFDMWAVGICLYHLSGASIQHILGYVAGEEPYQFQESLGFETNAILFSILCDQQRTQYTTSFPRLIYSLQQQKQRMTEMKQSFQETNQETENFKKQKDKIKEDFNTFLKIHKQIYNFKIEDTQEIEIQKLIEKYAEFNQLYALQIDFLISKNNLEVAIRNCDKIILMNPQSDTAYFNLGYIYDELQKLDESIKYFQKSLEINPLQFSSQVNIGRIYSGKGDNVFQKYYRSAIEIDNNCIASYYNMAIDNKHNHQKAILSYKKVLEINRKYHSIYQNIRECYKQTKQLEKSIYYIQQLKSLQEENGLYPNPHIINESNNIKRLI